MSARRRERTHFPRFALRIGWFAVAVFSLLYAVPIRAAVRGDVNLDTRVDAGDILVLEGYLAGRISLNEEALDAADVAPYDAVAAEITPDGDVNLGDLLVLVRGIDGDITLPAGPGTPTLVNPPSPTSLNPLSIDGTADVGSTLRVYVNGDLSDDAQCSVNASGNYTCTVVVLLDGVNTIRVVAAVAPGTSHASNEATVEYQNSLPRTPPPTITGEFVVWTKGEPAAPYVISSDFTIPSGSTLILTRGVEVRFTGSSTNLIVDGTPTAPGVLKVRGTDLGSNCVTFTSNAGSPSAGNWKGIEIAGASTASRLEWACIHYAERAVNVLAVNGNVTVVDSWITYFADAGVSTKGRAIVRRTLIDNTANPEQPEGAGIWVESAVALDPESGSYTDNEILGTATGVLVEFGKGLFLRNWIHDNATGVLISGYTSIPRFLDSNSITNNNIGIATVGLTAVVGQNQQLASPSINGNAIYDNDINVEAGAQDSQLTNRDMILNAERNWWGTADPNAIALSIEDRVDSNTPGGETRHSVDFAPFLDADGNVDLSYQMGLASDTASNGTDLLEDPAITSFTVLGRLHVPYGHNWTVPAGITLRVLGDPPNPSPALFGRGEIEVRGAIDIQGGTSAVRIESAVTPTPSPGDWDGIRITNRADQQSSIDGAIIQHAVEGIHVNGLTIGGLPGTGSLLLTNSTLCVFETAGVVLDHVKESTLEGNLIDNALGPPDCTTAGAAPGDGVGIQLVDSNAINPETNLRLVSNTIQNTRTGLHILGTSNPDVEDNDITSNTWGIWLQGSDFGRPLTDDQPEPHLWQHGHRRRRAAAGEPADLRL